MFFTSGCSDFIISFLSITIYKTKNIVTAKNNRLKTDFIIGIKSIKNKRLNVNFNLRYLHLDFKTQMATNANTPKGMRDFSPSVMFRRNYIFSVVKAAFEKYSFSPIETPAMENLETLTGKYGGDGDRLIFKVLNSGDYLLKTEYSNESTSKSLTKQISEKALRYDLTVPFARYIVKNRNEITFPFKRYQMQNVWRADRPQKGRFREFYQCDADVIGTDSLLSEIELIQLYDEVFSNLNIPNITICINNRKVLSGMVELMNSTNLFNCYSHHVSILTKT